MPALLSAEYNKVLEASIKNSVQRLSSLYASMIPESDYAWIASNGIVDLNAAWSTNHPATPPQAPKE
jgi:hypothetical protein